MSQSLVYDFGVPMVPLFSSLNKFHSKFFGKKCVHRLTFPTDLSYPLEYFGDLDCLECLVTAMLYHVIHLS